MLQCDGQCQHYSMFQCIRGTIAHQPLLLHLTWGSSITSGPRQFKCRLKSSVFNVCWVFSAWSKTTHIHKAQHIGPFFKTEMHPCMRLKNNVWIDCFSLFQVPCACRGSRLSSLSSSACELECFLPWSCIFVHNVVFKPVATLVWRNYNDVLYLGARS